MSELISAGIPQKISEGYRVEIPERISQIILKKLSVGVHSRIVKKKIHGVIVCRISRRNPKKIRGIFRNNSWRIFRNKPLEKFVKESQQGSLEEFENKSLDDGSLINKGVPEETPK